MVRRRTVYTCLCLLATILVGTVVVLSSISYYLSIDLAAYITEDELDAPFDDSRWNASQHGKVERVPRIIHQTWKSETLPKKWEKISQHCQDMMPDYEYVLWTDASSREFIAKEYEWFLDTFDSYTYPIQRADAIRYFVLYHYGGVYMDLDIGCQRPVDSLLTFPVILPRTIPVGVSNDLMFAEKRHPFMAQTIHNLIKWDYSWVLNYPTVMFSTGPMFLSAQYGAWTSAHPATEDQPGGEVRILPKALYGKNAQPEEAPHSFFSHYYGSSWHADDAAFISFLGHWGKGLMWVGLLVLVAGLIRLALAPHSRQRKYSLGRISGYDVMMPRWKKRNQRWYLDLGWFAIPSSTANTPHPPSSPISPTSSEDEDDVHLLPLSLDTPPSPSPSDMSFSSPPPSYSVVSAMRRAADGVVSHFSGHRDTPSTPSRAPRPRRSRGTLFFLPAFFTPSNGSIELSADRGLARSLSRGTLARGASLRPVAAAEYPPDKPPYRDEDDEAGATGSRYLVMPGYDHSRASTSSDADTMC